MQMCAFPECQDETTSKTAKFCAPHRSIRRGSGGGAPKRPYPYEYETKDGYVAVAQGRMTPHVGKHRLIMEKMLGRKLVKGESVHHKNGLRNDNSEENLEL